MFNDIIMDGNRSKFSKEKVTLWSGEIARDHISNGADLNEKIAQVAFDNHLNEEQIQRIVESTNLIVDSHKKGADFNTAKTASVITLVKKCNCEEKPDISDYMAPPSRDTSDVDLNEMFGVTPQDVQPSYPRRHVIKIKIMKLASAKQAFEDHAINRQRDLTEAERSLVKVAKKCIMEDKESLGDLYKMVKVAGYDKLADRYFPIINHVLDGMYVVEKNAFRIEDKYISKDLSKQGIPSVTVVNGNHAMIKSFETFKKIDDDIARAKRGILVCDDKIKKLKEEMVRIS